MQLSKRPFSTTAQLKDDIDSGRTGDKVAASDPGVAPLGTDDEAGGNSYTGAQADLARRTEVQTFSPDAGGDRSIHWGWWSIAAILVIALLLASVLFWR